MNQIETFEAMLARGQDSEMLSTEVISFNLDYS